MDSGGEWTALSASRNDSPNHGEWMMQMQAIGDDSFVVFVRDVDSQDRGAELAERELVSCPSYEGALWVRRECGSSRRKCIIRYVGDTGGGY